MSKLTPAIHVCVLAPSEPSSTTLGGPLSLSSYTKKQRNRGLLSVLSTGSWQLELIKRSWLLYNTYVGTHNGFNKNEMFFLKIIFSRDSPSRTALWRREIFARANFAVEEDGEIFPSKMLGVVPSGVTRV